MIAFRDESLSLPVLPKGYSTQIAAEFRDGLVSYELNRVYAPANLVASRPNVTAWGRLDRGLSYWAASWAVPGTSGGTQPEGRWLCYADVVARLGKRMSFAEFSSVTARRAELVSLLAPPSG